MAQEILKSELDLFKKVSFQGSIEGSQFIQYRPVSSVTATSAIEFDIPVAIDEYLDLQNVFLWYRAKLTQQNGTDYAANQNNRYSLINYGLNTIFDQLSIFLGGTLISQSANTYHYLAYIEAVTQNDKENCDTFLRSAGLIVPGTTAGRDYDAVDPNLSNFVNLSKQFTMYGRIHGSIFNSEKLLLNGVPLRLEFRRAPSQFSTMGTAAVAAAGGAAATEPKIELSDISLFVRKVKLAPSLLSAHAKALQISNAIYPIKHSIVRVLNLPANQSSFVIDNIVMGQQPCKVIVGIVSNNSYTGNFVLNPLAFKHYNLNYLCFNINGESYPKIPYQPDFANNNYEREYFELFSNLGATRVTKPPAIHYNSFKDGYCLYVYNFNHDFDFANENEYINIPKEGFMNLELKFTGNIAEALKVIFYAQFDNVIEIDQFRNVTVDYT